MTTGKRLQKLAGVAVLLTALVGCKSIPIPRGILEQQGEDVGMNSRELRIILDDLVVMVSGRIEHAADRIIAENDESHIRKNALLWKTNAISSCFQAASRRDPLGSFMDIWVLNKQSLDLFQRENQPDLFGESRSIAIDTTIQLESSMQSVLMMIGEDFPIGEDFAIEFAKDHPIHDLYFHRDSIAAHYTDYIERIQVDDRELREVVGNLDDQLGQLQKFSTMYAEFLPKQARWQAEIMLLDTLDSKVVNRSLDDMTLAAQGVARMATAAEQIPDVVQRERVFLLDAMTQERIATLNSLNQMQTDTVNSIDQMREETVERLHQERLDVMASLQDERAAVMDAIQQQRIAATEDLTEIGDRMFGQVDSAVDAKVAKIADHSVLLTDYIFKKAVQLCIGISVVFIVLIWLWRSKLQRSHITGELTTGELTQDQPVASSDNETPENVSGIDDRWRNAA